MRYFLFMLLIGCSLSVITAAENSGENSSRERSRGRGGRGMGRRGGNFFEQIKAKYPKEAAEIEKLQKSDPEKARSMMRDLMRKAMPEMGMRRGGGPRQFMEPTEEQIKELKAKFPEEFAAYEKLKTSDPDKAKAKLQELMKKVFGENLGMEPKFLRDRSRRATRFVIARLNELYPEKMQVINAMQKTDPDGARKELRKLFAEAKLQMPRGMRELNYEYVPPQQQNVRGGMMNRNFPFGGNRMMRNWGGRR